MAGDEDKAGSDGGSRYDGQKHEEPEAGGGDGAVEVCERHDQPSEREAARQAAGGVLGHQLRNGGRPQERAGDPGLLRGIANHLGGDHAVYGGGGADRLL